jgi:hypothetical protein
MMYPAIQLCGAGDYLGDNDTMGARRVLHKTIRCGVGLVIPIKYFKIFGNSCAFGFTQSIARSKGSKRPTTTPVIVPHSKYWGCPKDF